VAGDSSGDGVNHILLVRYHADGGVDGTLGPGGKVITSVGSHSRASALIQQPDGKLVVAGAASPVRGSSDVLLVRYLTDGRLDTSFGANGTVSTDFGGGDEATALVQQADGKLVVAGNNGIGITVQNTILARYHPDGSADESFGVGGKVSVNLGGIGKIPNFQPSVSALILQADG
jgi:uncharacterized delta-60 repeat protein